MTILFRRHLEDCPPRPWKNGGGTTRELWIHPPGSTLDLGFQARISVAEVGTSGPFSPFPGVDRSLLLLQGQDFDIDFGPRGVQTLSSPLMPLSFPGEWPARGQLGCGPCRDFNVMTARSWGQHRLGVFRSGDLLSTPASILALFAVGGPISLTEGLSVEDQELVVLERAGSPKIFGDPQASLIVVEFF